MFPIPNTMTSLPDECYNYILAYILHSASAVGVVYVRSPSGLFYARPVGRNVAQLEYEPEYESSYSKDIILFFELECQTGIFISLRVSKSADIEKVVNVAVPVINDVLQKHPTFVGPFLREYIVDRLIRCDELQGITIGTCNG